MAESKEAGQDIFTHLQAAYFIVVIPPRFQMLKLSLRNRAACEWHICSSYHFFLSVFPPLLLTCSRNTDASRICIV